MAESQDAKKTKILTNLKNLLHLRCPNWCNNCIFVEKALDVCKKLIARGIDKSPSAGAQLRCVKMLLCVAFEHYGVRKSLCA